MKCVVLIQLNFDQVSAAKEHPYIVQSRGEKQIANTSLAGWKSYMV